MQKEIDLRALKDAVVAVLDHITNDLGIEKLPIKRDQDFYWNVPTSQLYEVKGRQPTLDVGRLADDWEFVELMLRDKKSAVGAVLLHLAPLLRRVGEGVGQYRLVFCISRVENITILFELTSW